MDHGFLQSIPINVMDALKLGNLDVSSFALTTFSPLKMEKQKSPTRLNVEGPIRFIVPLVHPYVQRKL